MGNIIRNPLVWKELDLKQALVSYKQVLKKIIVELNAPSFEQLSQKMKTGEKLNKDQLKAYHALKLETAIAELN